MVQIILPDDLYEAIKHGENLSIVDVREDDEVAQGMIPGAKPIRLGDLENRLKELDKTAKHIMVCRSGGRSAKACEILQREGLQAINLVGGMTAWNAKYSQ
ncbi:rhodanese-like domain-containing protein [Pullulanibacillus sp. KACC 23026]|uniref:rhodanese-like domain-containing protein n=1 Tax=Pullulanibacillus sp. KACC 23026 TaxID=3028315 RepID=UPI0023B01AAA|nr:rhodanese-like domain-containing protein [Pullulanibacillus sp. KACC 23026]WEG12123.1 rhodanese-like domain-containing protein [Pullulanibacillus sp. KACC 23026]